MKSAFAVNKLFFDENGYGTNRQDQTALTLNDNPLSLRHASAIRSFFGRFFFDFQDVLEPTTAARLAGLGGAALLRQRRRA